MLFELTVYSIRFERTTTDTVYMYLSFHALESISLFFVSVKLYKISVFNSVLIDSYVSLKHHSFKSKV